MSRVRDIIERTPFGECCFLKDIAKRCLSYVSLTRRTVCAVGSRISFTNALSQLRCRPTAD
jgi:hypothetical protein